MRTKDRAALGAVACLICSTALSAQSARDAALHTLVERFVHAQTEFDVPVLKELTADEYVEISPVGDVDPREKMLGFYTPEHKQAMPQVAISDIEVHPFAHTAIVIAKLSYAVSAPDGTPRNLAIRASYVADETPSGWKLLSSQYTGIRPAKQQN